MKKITFLFLIITLIACNSAKRTKASISKGQYDKAIAFSVKKLRKNTTSKDKQKQILLLEEAFKKASEQDQIDLVTMKKDPNPAIIESIYETYIALRNRQDLIRPLLPLYITKENRNATFDFVDYSDEISNAKTSLSEYLYGNAQALLNRNTKNDARKAYDDLKYLDNINAGYRNVTELLEEAHFKGTNFVKVDLINDTNQVIPQRLEDDLLNFNSYDLNRFWTVFHSNPSTEVTYDYKLALLFKRIDVSPEQIFEKQTLLQREIKDGFQYVLDDNGNVVVDSLGNSIKEDKYITVSSDFFEIHQEKASRIGAEVVLSDLSTDQEIDVFPLESEFIFIHDFAEMSGDIRALSAAQRELIKLRQIPFPSDEQMIYDTGEDLKLKLKDIIQDLKI